MSQSQHPLVIIDGSGYIFRAFYALPPMTRPDGTPVNAVYGFCNMLLRTLEDHQVQSIVVAFDAARKTFRNDIYSEYKAHRPPPPEELVPQFSLIHEACHAFDVKELRIEGFEADDLIATLCEQALAENIPVRIITGDKDMLQLMQKGVEIFDPLKNKTLDEDDVFKKFGVTPEKVIEVQALCGDSTDNIPGVPGVGPKTAAELIQQYGTLENLYNHLEEIRQPKRYESLLQNKENAFLSYKLVQLRKDAPVTFSSSVFAWKKPVKEQLMNFLKEQAFHSLIKRLENDAWFDSEALSTNHSTTQIKKASTPEYMAITDKHVLESWITEIQDIGTVAIDTETTSLNPMQANLVGISLCIYPGKAAYIPIAQMEPIQPSLLDQSISSSQFLSLDTVIGEIKKICSDPSIRKIGHNIKYDLLVLAKHGVDFQNVEDTMLLSYLLNGSRHFHNMDDLAKLYLDHTTLTFSDLMKQNKGAKTFADIPLDQAVAYAAEDADITLQLYKVFHPQIFSEHLTTLYETIERPLISVLQKMEKKGALIDPLILKRLSESFSLAMSTYAQDIFQKTGKEFNLASPKQLGDILFQEMKLPGGKKGKNGSYSTDVDALEALSAQGHMIADAILEWRQMAKLKSTYTDALCDQIHPLTKRVHTSYGMTVTSTGRLSSSDPNLQNIPIRTEMGRSIRDAFIAPENYKLISLDYSQIELRLLAHVANIPELIDAFHANQDIHALTASQVFGIPLSDITKDIRSKAKAINFGIIYGISPFGLSRQLKIPQSESKKYIETYFKRYPGIQDYMNAMISLARKQGYVETLFGRRCFAPEINSKNPAARGFAERQAINAPLQGSNADIIKKAMIKIDEYLSRNQIDAQMILQVHDELVIEAHMSCAESLAQKAQEIMQQIVHLRVPLIVDYAIGNHWGEIH